MTQDLASAIQSAKGGYHVHQQQLRATQNFIDSNKIGLMDLPYDVRHLILEHHTEAQTLKVFMKGRGETPIQLPEAARAGNRTLRRECLLVALKKTTIEIHSGPGNAAFQVWLAKVDFKDIGTHCETGYDAVTSLKLPYFSRFPYRNPGITTNNDVQLCKKSRNLRELSINFHSGELQDYDAYRGEHVTRSAAALRKNYQLDGLLELSNLVKLNFEAYAPAEVLKGLLVSWFKEQYQLQRRSRQVAVMLNGVPIGICKV